MTGDAAQGEAARGRPVVAHDPSGTAPGTPPGARPGAPGPLADWRVVDLTDLRGALCGRILADLGADVVKVLRSDGGRPAVPASAAAGRFRDANKRGVTLDLDTAAGRARLDDLLAAADVLVENVPAGPRAALGLDPATVEAAHPRLVHVALADLGLTGPRAGWHLEALPALAASGALFASGFPDRPPCNAPGFLAHDCASVHGAFGAVAAVMDRRRHGAGQLAEVSVQEAALAGTTPWSVAIEDYTRINPRLPAAGTRNADGSYWVLPARDGWVRCVIGTPRQWDGFFALLGKPEALSGPEWSDSGFRLANMDAIRLVADQCLADRTRAELFEEARQLGTTVGVLHTLSEFVDHPQTRARGFFVATGFPGLGDAPFAAAPWRLSATPPSLRRAAPTPGDDATGFVAPGADHAGDGRPDAGGLLLAGTTVVELGVAAVVPELCWLLSELGADVIKIESLAHPDVLRQSGLGRINCGFAFNAECRGRRSVALDLGTERGRELALELCARATVVAENHRGGVVADLGLGEDAVRARNPSVVYVSSQGYGRGGPYGRMPAFGPLNAGFAGIHLLWNHPDVPYPCGTSLNHPDHIAGKLLAVAVLAALDHRARTGEGQLVEMAQTEAGAYLVGEAYLDAALHGEPAGLGNRSAHAAPHGVYPARGDDRWIAVVAADDAAWQRLVAALGWTPDPRHATVGSRLEDRDAIDTRLAAWTSERPADEAATYLQERGVSAMPVMGPVDHHADAHLAARGAIVHLEHPEVGPERHVANPLRCSRLEQRTAASAPCLGADTEQVLTTVLGLGAAEVAALVESRVCR
jgi:crotonobetainyl-CoA:carnitine CoA-transferase CaiB-like acyl-CoA transferase